MWAVQKPRVRELYLQQGKTLKEVITEMEQRYGFKAT
jgi:Clr5 domain